MRKKGIRGYKFYRGVTMTELAYRMLKIIEDKKEIGPYDLLNIMPCSIMAIRAQARSLEQLGFIKVSGRFELGSDTVYTSGIDKDIPGASVLEKMVSDVLTKGPESLFSYSVEDLRQGIVSATMHDNDSFVEMLEFAKAAKAGIKTIYKHGIAA
ncbi:hypothetical protein [Serratia marcescens]|uniref:hypothetical protein n=1 Tax=Serratia marcescens TaxID=615 RepID=UPI0002AF2143|nr:hypothetical protein [Serratia marcescens]AGE18463.1 hypothetical protein SMWW4_v1c26680 [Serratia marcescens WW4]